MLTEYLGTRETNEYTHIHADTHKNDRICTSAGLGHTKVIKKNEL